MKYSAKILLLGTFLVVISMILILCNYVLLTIITSIIGIALMIYANWHIGNKD